MRYFCCGSPSLVLVSVSVTFHLLYMYRLLLVRSRLLNDHLLGKCCPMFYIVCLKFNLFLVYVLRAGSGFCLFQFLVIANLLLPVYYKYLLLFSMGKVIYAGRHWRNINGALKVLSIIQSG